MQVELGVNHVALGLTVHHLRQETPLPSKEVAFDFEVTLAKCIEWLCDDHGKCRCRGFAKMVMLPTIHFNYESMK